VCNEEDRAFDLVRSAVGDGICQGFSMSTKAFFTGVFPETYDVGVVAVGDNSCSRKLGAHKIRCESAVWMRLRRFTASS
jgi:hypothetical protein